MKKIINKLKQNKKLFLGIIFGIVLSGTTVYASQYILASSEVSYDKTSSGLTSDNVQDALDELNTKANNMWCKSGYEKTDITGGYQCKLPVYFNNQTSWEDIAAAAQAGNLIANVGDTKTVDLGTLGTHTLRVANTTTPAECSTTGFSQTACGLVLEFADVIENHYMNSTGTNVGGWPASEMRSYLNSDIYNALPNELKSAIVNTTVISGHGCYNFDFDDYTCYDTGSETNFNSTDKLYLLDAKEVYGTSFTNSYNAAKDFERQLDYYKKQGVTTSNYSKAKKQYNRVDSTWWLRSAKSIEGVSFFHVDIYGPCNDIGADTTYGVSPAFRIG